MCRYCYAPHVLQRSTATYFCRPSPRRNILQSIESELIVSVPEKQIMLSFIGDVYCDTTDNNATTTAALELFRDYGAPVAVLTKGGKRCLKDLELFKQFGSRIWVGPTLTFLNEEKSRQWESGAALTQERLDTLRILKQNGVATFASFEPVIEPEESLAILEKSLEMDCVDSYKIGKVDSIASISKSVDWAHFLERCLALIRPTGKGVYIKAFAELRRG
jgi:DNA repair photolyase